VEKRDVKRSLPFESASTNDASCTLDAQGHCITCSDEALEARVLRVDAQSGLALVAIGDESEEIDTTLVEQVRQGDTLLVHGGVAIALVSEADHA
jgi:hydrogenase maturation factor